MRIATPSQEVLLSLAQPEISDTQQRSIRFITDGYLPDIRSYNMVFVINNAFQREPGRRERTKAK